MGPETFLSVVRLNLEASDLSEVKVWLFPILKQYTVGGRVSFFTETIFSMVETMSQKAQQVIFIISRCLMIYAYLYYS